MIPSSLPQIGPVFWGGLGYNTPHATNEIHAMEQHLNQLAAKYQVSRAAVDVIIQSLLQTDGRAAQFNHPELGGMGQWMPTMVMIGEMGNSSLQTKVAALCQELAQLVQTEAVTTVRVNRPWWPMQWGKPSTQSQQNDMAYAYFPTQGRLAVKLGAEVGLFDTTGHLLTGFSMQNGQLVVQTSAGEYLALDSFSRVTI